MRRHLVLTGLFTILGLILIPAARAGTPDDIIARIMAAPGDATVTAKALADAEVYVKAHADDATAQYAYGYALSHVGRKEEAIAAYDRAAGLDPKLDAATYNAGVVLNDLGRDDEAIARYEAAIAANPKSVDAYYNLGQTHYNHQRFAKALAAWDKARALAPGDFGIVKKVLQTDNALGRWADAAKVRAQLVALWKASKDPTVTRLTDYVFDQFDAAGWHVFAFETLAPSGGDEVVYSFVAADPHGHKAGTVTVERRGGRYVLTAAVAGGEKAPAGKLGKRLPAWRKLKPTIAKAIAAKLGKRHE
jgi:tetratricopeptide (TPR) repeat protein